MDPLERKYEVEEKVRSQNENLVLLHPNLIYGHESFLIRYMTQSVLAGSIPKSLTDSSVKYYPIHLDDLTKAITHSIDNFDDVKGKSFYVKGNEKVTLDKIKTLIEDKAGKKASISSNLGVIDFVTEFFYGISQDKNMCLMADYFKNNSWDFSHDNDYFKVQNLSVDHTVADFFKNENITEENYVFPLYTGYRSSEM